MIFHFDDLEVLKNNTYNFTPDSIPWLLSTLLLRHNKVCLICKDNTEMDFIQKNVKLINPNVNIIKFPSWDFPLFSDLSPTINNQTLRINTLIKLTNFINNNSLLLITLSSLILKIPPKEDFLKKFLYIKKNDSYSTISNIKNFLINYHYQRVDVVREKFEYSLRGSIIDIFPTNFKYPLRLDFFDENLESIRVFDPLSQLSKRLIDSFYIFPASEIVFTKKIIENFRVNFRTLNFGSDNNFYQTISNGQKIPGIENLITLFYTKLDSIIDLIVQYKIVYNETTFEYLSKFYDDILLSYDQSKYVNCKFFKDMTLEKAEIIKKLKAMELISISSFTNFSRKDSYKIITKKIPKFSINQFENTIDDLKSLIKKNKNKNFLFSTKNRTSKEKLKNFLQKSLTLVDLDKSNVIGNRKLFVKNLNIDSGFEYSNKKGKGLIVISDEDVFGKQKYLDTKKKVNAEKYFFEISNITKGDLVVHTEHGIGRFQGLINILLHNENHECIEVEYAGSDKLFIPVENLELISRYSSRDSETVSLDRLGSQSWQLRKANIKNKIKLIAHELINIAAKRKVREGKVFLPDEDKFLAFSSKFDYAETSDQLNAVNDIISDFQSGKPMDRLICGDVGFGKTEVAMRASYIVSDSGFKVAMLCPTTLLVNQHYKSFCSRFKDTNILILKISRVEKQSFKKEIIKKLQTNQKVIIIGTHAMLNDDFEFNNLGLLVIDEEQSFGVEQKEKIKKIKSNIHVLTLTATPIPRTLQFSILGIKDISLITTPPINRISIKTYLSRDDDDTLKNAINKEILRDGQVFYVTPKIKYIESLKKRLKKLFPQLRIGTAHGKLVNNELIKTYNDFYNQKINILISTSIIESGLDVPNANTIIIEKPNYFGLSQLYQIRGRVGRSTKQSYAYLMINNIHDLTDKAKKRLDVINKLDSLGAGFQLASHDLDIRGSGNILGSEQSGHIKEVGVELYQKLIRDAIAEIKDDKVSSNEWSPQINLGIPFFIPKEYIPEIDIRLNIYRRISKTNNYDELKKILLELRDRFGKIPTEIINLSKIIEIKNLAKKANIKKIDLGIKGFIISFRDNFKNYDKVINIVKLNTESFKFRKDNKLSFVKNWDNKKKAIDAISNFLKSIVYEINEKK